jgi:hypothetical protein
MNNFLQKKYLYNNPIKSTFSYMKNLEFTNLLKMKNYMLPAKLAAGLVGLAYLSKNLKLNFP